MAIEDGMGRERGRPKGLLPWRSGEREFELGQDPLEDAAEQLVLASHVVVQRHRLHAEAGRKPPHREGCKPVSVGKLDGRGEDAVTAEGCPWHGRIVIGGGTGGQQ